MKRLAITLAACCLTTSAFAQYAPPAPMRIGESAPQGADPGRQFVEPPAIPNDVANLGQFGGSYVGEYSLDQLMSLASANNPTLRQARYQITAQLATAQEAGLYPNPTVSWVAEQLGVKGLYSEFNAVEVEQRIVTANKLQLSRDKYLQRAKVAEHLAVAQQFRVCNDVRIHFYRVLAADEKIELHRELVKTAEDSLKTTREELNLGQANATDIRKANIALQKVRLDLMRLTNMRRQHVAELSALVGCDLDAATLTGDLAPEIFTPDFNAEYCRILASSPEVLAAHSKLREDFITLNREQVEPIPDIVIGGGPGYNFDANDTIANAFVRVEVPLFDRNQGNIRKARVDINRQQLEIRRIELDIKRRLAGEFNRLATALSQLLEYDDTIVPQSREAYRLRLEAYKDNRIQWPDVLTAQRDFTDRRIERVNHQLDARESYVLIGGYLLHSGLMAAGSPIPPGHMDSSPDPR